MDLKIALALLLFVFVKTECLRNNGQAKTECTEPLTMAPMTHQLSHFCPSVWADQRKTGVYVSKSP